ncbi:hypothetical protein IU438_11705 [Nocardia cyriacigeorgica]|nr:hypothetical protein [Nocardia cyriacigeorgica]MBF6162471.1 hypothetical protein [Nocardia cyriacigeorgica]MBF6201545.1 hypothetical protein [Nocardia cyriacigeorgica]MBF6317038.1 hypothetical protein [Nocardia cyriacigeorgica]MBF6396458.1 hypothetical protein [Nocardia cyriacigeorgica]MBF6402090.1 hypothetical protein [Nocardia cyriacigeorgica]
MEHFEGIPHEEIYANAQTMAPGNIHTYGDRFLSIATSLSGSLFGAHLAINRALSDGFDGQFATAALDAAKRFYDQATDVHDVIFAVGHRIKAAAYGAEVVKSSVPPPPSASDTTPAPAGTPTTAVQSSPVTLVDLLDPSGASSSGTAKEEQRQVAVGVMNTVYKPTYQPSGEGVPTFVPVQGPGEVGPGPVGPGSNGGGGSSQSGSGSGEGRQGAGMNGETGSNAATTEEPQVTAANSNPASSSGQNSTTSPQTGMTNTGAAAGTDSRSSTTAAGFPGGSSLPGGSGRSGSSSGGRTGSGAGSQAPGLGRSTPGVPTGGNAAGAAAAAGTGAGRAIGSGMPGMMPPGAGRRSSGDEESDRKTPDYLVGNHEEELLGRRDGTVPPVIGGDAQAARPQSAEANTQR